MARNEKLEKRVREALAGLPQVEEKLMFRGLTFIVNQKMCMSVGNDELLCRIGPAVYESALGKNGVKPMKIKDREYAGFVLVNEKTIGTKKRLLYWVNLSLKFNKQISSINKKEINEKGAIMIGEKKTGLKRRILFNTDVDRVFGALSTLKGLRGWWTTLVKGSTEKGGVIRFEFAGLKEHILMRVEKTKKPKWVEWYCLEHTELDEWNGTKVIFELRENESGICELQFQHVGLVPELECYSSCRSGWDYFLKSLKDYVEKNEGTPFGAE
jgi:TfoX/Sxy family transcriptional regulator of competence genes/uncharacterized protein YndB with AHSA1/START domain